MTTLRAVLTVTVETKPDGDYYFDHDDFLAHVVPWIEGGLDDRDDIRTVTITEQPAAAPSAPADRAALLRAADFFRGLRLTGTAITAADAEAELRRMADKAQQPDPPHVRAARYAAAGNEMAASLVRDGFGDDEIAAMLNGSADEVAPARHTCRDRTTAAGPDWQCSHCSTLPSRMADEAQQPAPWLSDSARIGRTLIWTWADIGKGVYGQGYRAAQTEARALLTGQRDSVEAQQPETQAGCGCPNENAVEHQFGTADCTCIPFVREGGTARYCQPGDTVDQISGWERGGDCPHHRPDAVEAQQPKEA